MIEEALSAIRTRFPQLMLPLLAADSCTPLHDIKWAHQAIPPGHDALIVYGGLGHTYLALKAWLHAKSERRLVFLESEPGIIRTFLDCPLAPELLKDPQVELWLAPDGDYGRNDEALARLTLLRPLFIALSPAPEARSWFGETSSHFISPCDALLSYMQEPLDQLYWHLTRPAQCFSSLMGRFQGVPAIVCGAGPSLRRNGHLLSKLRDRAFIIAAGSAITALGRMGIEPHLAVLIDGTAAEVERVQRGGLFHIPIIATPTLHRDAASLMRGPRVLLPPDGLFGLEQWLVAEMRAPVLPAGGMAANLASSVALRLGCNPIIHVGRDLAYTDGAAYAPGVVTAPALPSHTMPWQDYLGRPIQTEGKWLGEARWMARLIAAHPHITWINATEGGLGFPGADHRSLDSIALSPSNIQQRLNDGLRQAPQAIESDRVVAMMDEMEQSLHDVLRYPHAREAELAWTMHLAYCDRAYDQFGLSRLPGTRNDFLERCTQAHLAALSKNKSFKYE